MAQRMVVVQPKPGDLIEIPRGTFSHWAIYIGDGHVIHLTTLSGPSSSYTSWAGSGSTMFNLNEKAIIKQEKLSVVVGGDTYYIHNHLDDKYEPRSVIDILKDAQSWVGQELLYYVTRYNCEHFVTELRYGKPESRQVKEMERVAVPGLLGAVAAFASVIVMKLLRIS